MRKKQFEDFEERVEDAGGRSGHGGGDGIFCLRMRLGRGDYGLLQGVCLQGFFRGLNFGWWRISARSKHGIRRDLANQSPYLPLFQLS